MNTDEHGSKNREEAARKVLMKIRVHLGSSVAFLSCAASAFNCVHQRFGSGRRPR